MLSIDITDKQVKLVRGTLSGNKIRVVEVETRVLTLGCVSNGYITDIPMVAGEITDIISTKGIKDKEAIVCINSGSILYKELVLPKPKNIANSTAIESMILNTMGVTKEYNISYSIIGETVDENNAPMIKLTATACPQRMVDGYIRLFTQLGLNLKQINISNNCITRLVLNTPKLESSMPLLLVQIDEDFLNINLYEDGQVALSRYVKIDASDYDDDPNYVNMAVYDNLFRTIQFISSRKNSRPLKEIMFYGYVKDFISLSNAISSFNLPAHILSIPNNIVTFCDLDFTHYANAIGAFFKVRKDLDHVNLLQSSAVKEKKGAGAFLAILALLAVGSAALCAGGTLVCNAIAGGTAEEIKKVQAEIDSKQAEVDALQAKISVFNSYTSYKDNLTVACDLFDYMPKATTDVRAKLVEALPEGVKLIEEVEVSEYSVSLKAITEDPTLPSKYVRNLIEQDYFENIVYEGFDLETDDEKKDETAVSTSKEKEYSFELTMLIKGGNDVEVE